MIRTSWKWVEEIFKPSKLEKNCEEKENWTLHSISLSSCVISMNKFFIVFISKFLKTLFMTGSNKKSKWKVGKSSPSNERNKKKIV
jgi:hypothetical protein